MFLAPVVCGVVATLMPAFGFLPTLGGARLSLAPWRDLAQTPGIDRSIALTLFTGFGATIVALCLAMATCAWLQRGALGTNVGRLLAPLLATPHSAMALGFAFAIAPSGWIVRMLSPWLTGWNVPPDVALVGDSWGLALIAALVLKETPYLILMTIGALHQVDAQQHLRMARSMGYGRVESWIKTVLPLVYPQIRLPVLAVLAFSLSIVDVALIVGPDQPPPLAVIAVRDFADPRLDGFFTGAAASCAQLAIVALALLAWRAGERVVAAWGRGWIARGRRATLATPLAGFAVGLGAIVVALSVLSLAALACWSLAAQWRYPDALPVQWTLANWMRLSRDAVSLASTTAGIAVCATALAIAIALACLENEDVSGVHTTSRSAWLLYTPLLVPQIVFLFGAQALLVATGYDGTLAAVVWAHLVFVLPYVFLSLAHPWRALDRRYARTAASLGASPARIFWRVKLSLLLPPLLIAGAVGFAVSVGLYLPTLFAGGGRIDTLTLAAVTLASGADRRTIGVYAGLQALLPCIAYMLALAISVWSHARRSDPPAWL
ncbi:MAG TPA: ABC transporter permease [Casimicrobiaceae bacterium]|nr:ABC transporter permease [Casimicrobiaceae bacterium]